MYATRAVQSLWFILKAQLLVNPITVSSIVLWCHRPMDKYFKIISRDVTTLFQMRFDLMVKSLECGNLN